MFDWLRKPAARASPSAHESAEALIGLGRRAEDEGRLPEACELYRRAIAAAPGFGKAHLNLGAGLAAAGDTEGAIKAYESALALEPDEPYASYNLGCLLFARGELARAEALLRAALSRKPEFAEAHVALANVQDARGDGEAAAASLALATRLRPDFAGAWHNYGVVLKNMGRLAEANAALRRTVEIDPDFRSAEDADAWRVLGSIARQRGRPGEAVEFLTQSLRRRGADPVLLNELGVAYAMHGDPLQAERVFSQAVRLRPEHADAHLNLGLLLGQQGRLEEAIACLGRGIAQAPGSAALHYELGNILTRAGRTSDAIAAYRSATRLQPDHFRAQYSLALALRERGAHQEALACVDALMHLTPRSAEEHFGMANVLRDADRTEDMLEELRKTLALDPEHAQARWALAVDRIPAVSANAAAAIEARAAFGSELAALDAWLDPARAVKAVDAVGAPHPFALAYQEENNRELLARYGALCTRIMAQWAERERLPPAAPRAARRPLRVGVVSQFFFNHSVWHAPMRGWLEHFDRERIALHAFYLGTRQDEQTRFAEERAAHFETGAGDLRTLAETLHARRLDVLIYPELGMNAMTLRLAALRLAPVQMVSWGHPETSGLPSIDYYLSAADFEPPGAQAHYTETLVALPNFGCCYSARRAGTAPPDLGALGLDGNAPLLLCPGTPYKYAPHHDAVFVRIARRLGRCQFVFFVHQVNPRLSDKLRARLEAAFRGAGLNAHEFLRFVPWQDGPRFFGLMARAEVFLDTIGFSGFNTAMQAVECASPIVTREGRFMRGRFASGILKRMGLGELVAQSDDAYVELAVRLARDAAYRAQLKRRIEEQRAPLFDDVATVRALQDFLIRSAAPRRD